MICPYCKKPIPDAVIASEAGRRNAAKRKRYGAGPGRPPKADRCACGLMTATRAAARGHRCEERKPNADI